MSRCHSSVRFFSAFVRSAITTTKSCMFPVCLVLLNNNVETLQSWMLKAKSPKLLSLHLCSCWECFNSSGL